MERLKIPMTETPQPTITKEQQIPEGRKGFMVMIHQAVEPLLRTLRKLFL